MEQFDRRKIENGDKEMVPKTLSANQLSEVEQINLAIETYEEIVAEKPELEGSPSLVADMISEKTGINFHIAANITLSAAKYRA